MKLITCSFNYSVTFVFLSSLIFKLLTTNSTLCLKFTPALFFGALLFKFQNFKTFQRLLTLHFKGYVRFIFASLFYV